MLERAARSKQVGSEAMRHARIGAVGVVGLVATACGAAGDAPSAVTGGPPAAVTVARPQVATVGTSFTFDATQGGSAFTDPKGRGLSYSITFLPSANGLVATAGAISGSPAAPGVIHVVLKATDVKGDTASETFAIVAFAAGLATPTLPATSLQYSDAANPLPPHFLVDPGNVGPVAPMDNTPASNPITDPGATLGRVLFYDPRLSINDRVSCSSCHHQALGFGDTARFSLGVAGVTARKTMGLANARFYQLGHFFWDERAATLEDQILMPIQNKVEMGMTLDDLVLKVSLTSYYPPLFQSAFGTPDVTTDRISRAVAQFVRSMVSSQSRFDAAFNSRGVLDTTRLSPTERQGQLLFSGAAGCSTCHVTNGIVLDAPHNTGLDLTITDQGAGGGRFKAPSLRNVAVRPPYMHDGRFQTLPQVVEFYDSGVQPTPGLDSRLRTPNGPKRLNLTSDQRSAIVDYLRTLTDSSLLTAPKYSTPFVPHP